MASQYNPYEAPTFDDDGNAERGEELTLATRGSRLAAAMLDSALVFVPLVAVFFVIGGSNGVASWMVSTGDTPNVGEPPAHLIPALVAFGVLCLILFGVQCYLLIKSAQTIGKRVMGIQIVNASDGGQTGFGRILFLRILAIQLAGFFPLVGSFVPLIDALLIFRQDSRCLHDHIAGTIVVKVQR